jgi:predicted outer membrane repeat protein
MAAKIFLKSVLAIVVLFLLTAVSATAHANIIYVDDDAAGSNDGSSWTDAYRYLQDALSAANDGDEIRVAQGVYKPDQGDGITLGDREATFQLINGVTLKGGYAGADTPDPNARDIKLYETILSGDLEGNDVEIEDFEWVTIYDFTSHPSRAENSCHVVTGSGTDATAVLDGVTITCGNAYGPEPGYCNDNDNSLTYGAGMYNDSGSPTLVNCTFYRNTSWTIYIYDCPDNTFDTGILDFDVSSDLVDFFMPETSGAGIYNLNSSMTLRNCTFEENMAFGADSSSAGGGIHNVNSDVMLINCIFKTNVATGFDSEYWGGAIANSNSNPTLEDCSFIGNLAYYGSGGALTLSSSTSATLTNCRFVGNVAGDGGAISGLGQATLTNCAFHENIATSYGSGGAIFTVSGNPTLVNCTFSRNSANKGGSIFHKSGATLINCVFTENSAGGGAGIFSPSHYGTLIVRDCTFSANKAEGWGGGGMYNGSDGNSIVTNCVFITNLSERHGGGMYNWKSNTTITNCTFRGNKAREYGGGIYSNVGSQTLTNCIFSENSAEYGGGIFGGQGTIQNCIISQNTAEWGGGLYGCNGTIKSCIISGNKANDGGGGLGWCDATILNNTICGNAAEFGGGLRGCPGPIRNCIIWSNTSEINLWGNLPTYCCIRNWTDGGQGNIASNPRFFEPGYWDDNATPTKPWDDVWIDGDYHLLLGSPCIDAGDPNYIAGPNETDLDGKPRVIGGRIDMGAYEVPIPAEARILPRTINLASKGNWITCSIWLPDDYDVADIEPGSVMLERQIKAEQFLVDEHKQVATAAFDREKVQSILNVGDIELKITCQLTDGTYFEAKDIIRVINKSEKN